MREEFNFYEESNTRDTANTGYDEVEVRDIKGVTDSVSEYVFVDMEYPNVCLKADLVLPKHKWEVISKLSQIGGNVDKNISLYIVRNDELYKIGALSGVQIKSFLDIVGIENIVGHHKDGRELVGSKLYVLSS